MIHSLMPSETFGSAEIAQGLIQTGCMATSVPSAIAFYASRIIASTLSFDLSVMGTAYLSMFAKAASGGNETVERYTTWIAPLSGMAAVTFAAYKLYALSSSSLITGAICGAHVAAMSVLSYTPNSGGSFGVVSLKNALAAMIPGASRFRRLDQAQQESIQEIAEIITSVAFVASSIALTILLENPILANAAAYAIAPVVKHVALICLREIALFNMPNNNVPKPVLG